MPWTVRPSPSSPADTTIERDRCDRWPSPNGACGREKTIAERKWWPGTPPHLMLRRLYLRRKTNIQTDRYPQSYPQREPATEATALLGLVLSSPLDGWGQQPSRTSLNRAAARNHYQGCCRKTGTHQTACGFRHRITVLPGVPASCQRGPAARLRQIDNEFGQLPKGQHAATAQMSSGSRAAGSRPS